MRAAENPGWFKLIRQRWRQIRATLADHEGALDHAREIGPPPCDPAEARSWLTAATAITAYRERYELPAHVQLLGERPGPLRPDAQAAYDHTLLQIDRHLARPYQHLTTEQLQQALQEVIAASQPPVDVDPEELRAAHAAVVANRRRSGVATAVERAKTRDVRERRELVAGSLERTVTRRTEQAQEADERIDTRRRIELALTRRGRR
jgi:hypothetical protein